MKLEEVPQATIFPRVAIPSSYTSASPSGLGYDDERSEASRRAPKWRPGFVTILIVIIALAGLGAGLYPMTSQWVSSYNQTRVITDYTTNLGSLDPSVERQLALAEKYNEALTSGALLEANSNVPQSDGQLAGDAPDYWELLRGSETGVMGRVKIDAIGVDLPIYHGTGEDALLRGAGHLQGSHLPIGGESRHSVVTAHRGLANSAMFTDLDKVKEGDTFTLEVLGEVFTYQVMQTKVVDPDDTDTIRPEVGRDLVTLVTCTPLGINTHRILVTGERITPTPKADLDAAGKVPEVPGFPWWAVWGALGLAVIAAYLVRSGRADARLRERRTAAAERAEEDEPTSSGRHSRPQESATS